MSTAGDHASSPGSQSRGWLADASTGLPSGVVTFLLTDVVGSTRMWEAASEMMAQVLPVHDAIIRAAVEMNGGVVLKSRGEGDSTFNVFARATDAVVAARAIQTALAAEPWPATTVIRARMALHTGEAIEREGDYYGRPVNRVARLRGVADAGQVLVSQATYEIVADRLPADARLIELGERELRDLTRPEVVYALIGADEPVVDGAGSAVAPVTPASSDRNEGGSAGGRLVPLPKRLVHRQRTELAGRDRDGKLLAQRFTDVAAGRSHVVLIGGEPGIGKTALASSAALAAHEAGATVLLGRCDEDVWVSYRPWIEALTHLVVNAPQSMLGTLDGQKLADLGGLIPQVATRVAGLPSRVDTDEDHDRYLLFEAVAALMTAASQAAPIVLILDDLQWADRPSLALLRHLLQSTESMRLLVLATYRDGDLDAAPALADLLAALHREDGAERLELSGLDDEAIVEMMERAAGHALDADGLALARVVRRDTVGNPFYATEMLRHLAESGVIVRSDHDRWVTAVDLSDFGLPQSVRDVVGRRVARLGGSIQQTLRFASVIGREFDVDVLAAMSGIAELDLIEQLEQAHGSALVAEVRDVAGRFGFAHALVQQTLYGELSATRRQLVHRKAAEALELVCGVDPGPRIAELARQWMAAARPADSSKAIDYARRAGDAAVAALAPDDAARWYFDALDLLDKSTQPDLRQRMELLIALGTAQRQGGEETLMEAARLARSIGDTDGLVRAVLANTGGWQARSVVVSKERPEMVAVALDAVGPDDSARRARLLKLLATERAYLGDSVHCQELYAEALAMARRVGDKSALLDVLVRGFAGFWTPDTIGHRLDASREAAVLAADLADPAAEFWANHDLARVAISMGYRDDYDQAVSKIDELSDRFGSQPALWSTSRIRSGVTADDASQARTMDWLLVGFACADALQDGELRLAEAHIERGYELSVGVRPASARVLRAMQLGMIRVQQHRETEIVDLIEQTVVAVPHLHPFRALLVKCLAATGDDHRAQMVLTEAAADGFATPWDVYWLITICWWAEVTARFGDPVAITSLYDRLAPFDGQLATVSVMTDGAVSHYLGVLAAALGDRATAEGHLMTALQMHEELRLPFQVARTQLELGRLLITGGVSGGSEQDAARSRSLLESVRAAGAHFGFAGFERDATALLARVG